ncbi:DUF1266 domain-containing protein [Bartonella sp. HY761]|uniref:DUF1266 domain-containing protein n=1 Tax=Bartonella sp. HY761 TaxID=2979330 RepID=UPI0021FACC7E|nr:DUF1266 domain-containing protein [Bartonella sp. HY761]UXN05623.1 DUF1266 domain-containing protein [Bartonella sp. HY761]
MAVNAPYSEGRVEECQYVAAIESERRLKSALKSAWGIVDGESFEDISGWLLHEGHRYYFDMVAERAIAMNKNPTIERMNEDVEYFSKLENSEGLVEYYEKLITLLESDILRRLQLPPVKSIMAWDMARLIGITLNALALEYVDEDKAWESCSTALSMTRYHYSNWKEFADAFLFGRAFWFDFDDETMPEIYGELKNRSKITIKCFMIPILFGLAIPCIINNTQGQI